MKEKCSLSVVTFFLFLAVCIAALCILPKQRYAEKEKRYLTAFPELKTQTLLDGTAQDTFSKWLADAFPFRDFWVGTNAYLKLAEGRNTQQDVYLCRGGYLINAPETLDLERYTQNLQRFEAFARTTGLPASAIIVPSSGYVNVDRLPAGHGAYHDAQLFERAGEVLEQVKLYDPREALCAANGTRGVYYRTDHHLTAYGSFTLYDGWMRAQGRTPLDASAFQVTSYDGFYGTTWTAGGYWLVPADPIELWDSGASAQVSIDDGDSQKTAGSLYFPEHLEALDKYPVYLDGNHAITQIENPDAPEGVLLIVKDSYAHCLTTFLANSYRTIYMIDLRYYRGVLSGFAAEHGVTELLYVYGVNSLLTDSNSAWLF